MDKPEMNSAEGDSVVDVAAMSITELADHIERTHHTYLGSELPRLEELTSKVASVHGERDSRLASLSEIFQMLVAELSDHMKKEEQILFPMVRQLDASKTTPEFHCGSLANPIQQMELEHTQAGMILDKLSSALSGIADHAENVGKNLRLMISRR